MLDLLQLYTHDLAEPGFESRPLFLGTKQWQERRILSFAILNHTFEFGKNKNFHLNIFLSLYPWFYSVTRLALSVAQPSFRFLVFLPLLSAF